MATGSGTSVCLADYQRLAAARLPANVWDFISGGSGSELTLAANRTALDGVFLIPRILQDVAQARTSCELVGSAATMPVAVAPVAYHRLYHPDGELASAAAAKAAGVPFTISTLSSCPLEEIASVGATTWFQLYWLRDQARRYQLISRAEDAGCTALMLTVDMPWMARRLRDVRNAFALPPQVTAANLTNGPSHADHATDGDHGPMPGADSSAYRSAARVSAVSVHSTVNFEARLTWDDVADLRKRTRLPLILKGVLAPEDAMRAVDLGVDALVVSNHGGRQLDGAVPSIDVLASVRAAVGESCQVLMDSGIRSGTDVLRALARGADGVLIGRPLVWGLAADGEHGARSVLELLSGEVREALALAGCPSPADAGRLRTLPYPLQHRTPVEEGLSL